jgi:hypothetical protein
MLSQTNYVVTKNNTILVTYDIHWCLAKNHKSVVGATGSRLTNALLKTRAGQQPLPAERIAAISPGSAERFHRSFTSTQVTR